MCVLMNKRAKKGFILLILLVGWFLNGENSNGIAKVTISIGIMDSGPEVKNHYLISSFMRAKTVSSCFSLYLQCTRMSGTH